MADTGLETMTGGRIKRIAKYVGEDTFMMTYGDGISDVNIGRLLEFHKSYGRGVLPPHPGIWLRGGRRHLPMRA